jgi:hypothetical protein
VNRRLAIALGCIALVVFGIAFAIGRAGRGSDGTNEGDPLPKVDVSDRSAEVSGFASRGLPPLKRPKRKRDGGGGGQTSTTATATTTTSPPATTGAATTGAVTTGAVPPSTVTTGSATTGTSGAATTGTTGD